MTINPEATLRNGFLTIRGVHRAWGSALAAVLTLGACGDAGTSAPPGGPSDEEPPRAGLLASSIGTLAYVALESAAMPGADRVVVRAPGGDSARTQAVQGGFDPLALSASEGETVTVAVTDSAGRVTEARVKVAPRPPRVVRLSPAERRTDVPLNARVFVVFSVPMDPASVSGRVRLLRDGAPAAGRVELGGDGTVAEFVPAEPLAALTEHTLVVDGEVTDVRGQSMGEAVSGTFRTGASAGQIASIRLEAYTWFCDQVFAPCPSSLELSLGEFLSVTYQVFDGDGQLLQWPFPVTLRSSDDGVLQPGPWSFETAVVTVRGLGRATLEASTEGLTTSLEVEVTSPVPMERLQSLAVLADYAGELWRVPLDGSAALRLASYGEVGAPPKCHDVDPLPGERFFCFPRYEFAVSPEGRIAITHAGHYGAGGVWVKDDPDAAPRTVLGPLPNGGAARSPAWSPDGRQLAYWLDREDTGESELRVVNADGSDERVLRRMPFTPERLEPFVDRTPVHWHADGQRLLIWNSAGTEAVPLDGSPPSTYLVGYLVGPRLADGRTHLLYGKGTYSESVLPAYSWALHPAGALQGTLASPPRVPRDVQADLGLLAVPDGVLTVGGQWVYRSWGRILGFAR